MLRRGGTNAGLDCGFHHAAFGEELYQAGGERWASPPRGGMSTSCEACRPEVAAALRVEDQVGQLARLIEFEALGNEDQPAARGDHDGTFVGGEDLLDVARWS